jgi:hypothetical protein
LTRPVKPGSVEPKCACTEGSGDCDPTRRSQPDVNGSQDFRTESCKGAFPRIAQFYTFLSMEKNIYTSGAIRNYCLPIRTIPSMRRIPVDTFTSQTSRLTPTTSRAHKATLHKLKTDSLVTPKKSRSVYWLGRLQHSLVETGPRPSSRLIAHRIRRTDSPFTTQLNAGWRAGMAAPAKPVRGTEVCEQ